MGSYPHNEFLPFAAVRVFRASKTAIKNALKNKLLILRTKHVGSAVPPKFGKRTFPALRWRICHTPLRCDARIALKPTCAPPVRFTAPRPLRHALREDSHPPSSLCASVHAYWLLIIAFDKICLQYKRMECFVSRLRFIFPQKTEVKRLPETESITEAFK